MVKRSKGKLSASCQRVSFLSFSSAENSPVLIISTHLRLCVWSCRWDKVCECIQSFPVANAAVIRYWFIVTVAMATPDWNTNPTDTVRTWNHIALPTDDWQALFLRVTAWDEAGQQMNNSGKMQTYHSYIYFSVRRFILVTSLDEVSGSNHCTATLLKTPRVSNLLKVQIWQWLTEYKPTVTDLI